MRRLWALLLCVALSPTLASAQSGWSSYTNAEQGYSLSYPAGWVLKPPNAEGIVFVDTPRDGDTDLFIENLNFTKTQLDRSYTTAEMEADILKTLSAETPQFVLSSKTYPKWNGRPSFQIVYSSVQSSNSVEYRLKVLQRVLIVGNTVYLTTYTALAKDYDRYFPTVNRVIDSFTLN